MIDKRAFTVRATRCATCIFGPRSPIPPERLEELKATWASEDRAQECHHHTARDEHVGCAGHYQMGRLGIVYHPVIAIARQIFPQVSIAQAYEVFERLGWVHLFEDEDAEDQE